MAANAFSQSATDSLQLAIRLTTEAKKMLQKEKPKAFDKLRALGKFKLSQQILIKHSISNDSLQSINSSQIKSLGHFFQTHSNRDSLLLSTIFYPDSIFQSNPKYAKSFKQLVLDILDNKKRKTRIAFFKIEALSVPPSAITFENYWPLEVIEFENSIHQKENSYQSFPKKVRDELLLTHFQKELDALLFEASRDSFQTAIQYINQQKKDANLLLEEQRKQYNYIWYAGLGIIALLLLWEFFARKKTNRLLKSMNQNLLEEKKRSEELLLNILPAEVARELKSQGSAKAYKYDQVSVLFSDFQGFSKIAEQLSPEELVGELDFCFKAFDRIIDKYRLQKIKTIGDAYMCVGGLYTKGNNHIKRMIFAALEIQLFLDELRKKRAVEGKHFFVARIGIHTGPIVAGVVGSKKFAFDIWGNTVNVAQQMEAHGQVNEVNISGETFELVKDQFICQHRKKILVKNQQEYDMYFVKGMLKKT